MWCKEIKNFLGQDDKDFIEKVILNYNFPFYHQPSSVLGDNNTGLNHIILRRPEERQEGENYNSDFYPEITRMIRRALKKAKINLSEFLRIGINYTYNNGQEKCPAHLDHDKIKHKQIIIYLNDCLDKKSKTVLLSGKKIFKSITPEKYKAAIFDDCYHYHYYPTKGFRLVIVCTFC